MTQPLRTCPACEGFAPVSLAACPHCDAALPTRRPRALARVLATLVGGSAVAMTLMACYGAMPHRAEGPNAVGCYHDQYGGSADSDADGYCSPQDCNDTNAAVFPGAEDPDLDTIDQNCDGVDGWRDPGSVATPPPGEVPAVLNDAGAAPVEPTPIATEPAPPAS